MSECLWIFCKKCGFVLKGTESTLFFRKYKLNSSTGYWFISIFIKMQTSWNKDQSLHKWPGPWSWLQPGNLQHYNFFPEHKQKITLFTIVQTTFSSSHFVSTIPAAIQWALIYIVFCAFVFQIWSWYWRNPWELAFHITKKNNRANLHIQV